ncbi:ankyrin repeat-containing domain protein [Dactylonectria macrodidyma]|uniref:Ankyrin repeat-containing domain protein n=1 Tax=Dactylonectria macrodidyma TaxID=307937 RepID=A0A9P9J190_9HYPO|nr:ankyrin repeat-containing domain protein [Dactylonectria macrodidyma]
MGCPRPYSLALNSIIAVHGLGGDQDSTWTWAPGFMDSGPEVMWLKELLPLHVSNAHVITFGYSMMSRKGISVGDVKAVAEALLNELREKHPLVLTHCACAPPSGSNIFIGHGLRGLIIKEVRTIAREDDYSALPLIHLAAQNGQLDLVKHLSGLPRVVADVTDEVGRTPLSYAAEFGHLQIVKFLAEQQQADINSVDKSDRSPLSYAADALDKDLGDEEKNRTPTYLAAYWGYSTAVSELIKGRAASDVPDEDGWQPLHAAYDNPDVLMKLLDESGAEIQCQTNGGETILRGIPIRQKPKPLCKDLEDITPLQLAGKRRKRGSYTLDVTPAKRVASQENIALDMTKDKRGCTTFTQALANTSIEAARALIMEGAVDINQVNKEGKAPLELAMLKEDRDDITELLLHHIDRIDKGTIRDLVHRLDLLIWVIERDQAELKTKIWKILEGGEEPPTEDQSRVLFECATNEDDVSLAEYLVRCQPDLATKYEHRWTLQQLIAAYCPVPETDGEKITPFATSFDDIAKPQVWSEKHKASELAFVDEDKRNLRYSNLTRTWYTWSATARADHPIDPSKKFYFESTVIDRGEEEVVGIGFGHKGFDPTDMPGWASTTWSYHGDDGGLFHDGIPKLNSERTFKTGDTVGCCIDPINGKAYFTRNGKPVGRLFPMVGLRSHNAEIRVNFDWDEPRKQTDFAFRGDLETAFLEAKEVNQ